MQLNVIRRDNRVQLGVGAAALLLPPLALGAAFYSMLAEPDENVAPPAAAEATAPPPAVAVPATVGAEATAFQVKSAEEGGPRPGEQLPVQGNPVQAGPPIQPGPIQVAATPAATVNPPADAEGSATTPAAESPPAPAAPKRNAHKHRQPHEDPYPVRTWLQQIGILPRTRG